MLDVALPSDQRLACHGDDGPAVLRELQVLKQQQQQQQQQEQHTVGASPLDFAAAAASLSDQDGHRLRSDGARTDTNTSSESCGGALRRRRRAGVSRPVPYPTRCK